MENLTLVKHSRRLLAVALMMCLSGAVFAQDKVDEIVDRGVERNENAKDTQERIDKIAEETDKVVSDYKRQMKVIEGLKIYNQLLQRQLDDQQAEISDLQTSIEEVAIIERQITPLMLRMIEGLEKFIQADVPFLLEERMERVERLRSTMDRSDVTAAEKFRSVLEAYEIENEYGRTMEAYKGDVEIDGKERQVDFLKVGRIVLAYQSINGQQNGVWDQRNREWVELDTAEYKNRISKGLQIAREQVAPDLLMLPVSAAEDM